MHQTPVAHARLEMACSKYAQMGIIESHFGAMQAGTTKLERFQTQLKSMAEELIQPRLKVSKLCSVITLAMCSPYT